jgi:hypothetical protein
MYAGEHAGEKAAVIGKLWLGIACCAAAPAWAGDAAEPLDIKPGLWEITLTVQTSGLPPMPPEVLAKLTPEELARIDRQARQRAAEGPRSTVKKRCLEEKELRQPLTFAFNSEGQGCRQTLTRASRTGQDMRVDCGKDATHGGGTVRIEATDPEHVKVSSHWSATDGVRTMKMNSIAALRWLGQICELDLAAAPKATAPPPPATLAKPAKPAKPTEKDAAYYYKLGREQTAKNDFWGALQSLNQAIQLNPESALSYNARGYVYLRMRGYANAVVEFSNAIRLRADYANAYQNRAIARRHLGDEEGAAADSRKAEALSKQP